MSSITIFIIFFKNLINCLVYFYSENARLRSVHHNLVMSRSSSRHFLVSIPRVLLQRREDSNRKYFAYEIQITPVSGENEKWSLLRRYSEFHRLDKYLQKSNPMIKTLDFPPKKSFGNMVSVLIVIDSIKSNAFRTSCQLKLMISLFSLLEC